MNILIGKMLGLGVHAFLLPSLLPLARTGLAESRKCRSNMVRFATILLQNVYCELDE